MKKILFSILIICSLFLVSCGNLPLIPSPTSTATLTPIPSSTPTKTLVPTSTPQPVSESYVNMFPLDNQISPLSKEQVNQVKECDIEKLASDRYPEKNKTEELSGLFSPETPCDWATLAFAYAARLKERGEMPEVAKDAFGKAIADNPGFALSTPLFYRYYYDSFTIVAPPDIFKQDITEAQITYKWNGMGDQIEYTIEIQQADTDPIVTLKNLTPSTLKDSAKTKAKKETLQALGKSLNNLIPINSQFSLTTCYDNYPDWTVSLTLTDGTIVELTTNNSNMVYIGGPWQINIDGQNYIQFSIEFINAIDTLIQEIGLPYGEPMAMTCGARDVFEQAYP